MAQSQSADARVAGVGVGSTVLTAGTSTIFGAALVLGAGLIFTVEPMFAKMVLPKLGGSPAVWNTCLVFFQVALLAGYAYAHLLTTRLVLRTQVAVHISLVVLAIASLPITVSESAPPSGEGSPIPWLFGTLLVGLGGPFVVLSATAPLLQKWFARTDHPFARDPYHLYAASNFGSFAALVAYPLVIEPMWSLEEQGAVWAISYAIYGALSTACALLVLRRPACVRAFETVVRNDEQARVTWRQRTAWLLLSMVPSSLLLGVTTYLSTDIASVPLLWTVPLALYLLTFVVAFARTPLVPERLAERVLPLAVTALVVTMVTDLGSLILVIGVHLFAFVACALRLHIALARTRPAAENLTEFYLWIAVGGVLGGSMNTFVAPLLFDTVLEYPAALGAACLLHAWFMSTHERRLTRGDLLLPAFIGVTATAANWAVRTEIVGSAASVTLVIALALASLLRFRRSMQSAVAMTVLLTVMHVMPATRYEVLLEQRTFFGVNRVREEARGNFRILTHGNTVHGRQHRASGREFEPMSYYHRSGPIGQVMTALASRLERAEIGVIGLGAGGLSAYAVPGQQWTFYEIDPAVAQIARSPEMFTFLEHCGDRCRVVLGDGRLSLARDASAKYDMLILDAFSSDSVPVHMMTREAFRLYTDRLAPDGLIAVHISSRNLNLRPVLASVAVEHALVSRFQLGTLSEEARLDGGDDSEWVIMSHRAEDMGTIAADSRWQTPAAPAGFRVWTDDFSNILSVLGKPRPEDTTDAVSRR